VILSFDKRKGLNNTMQAYGRYDFNATANDELSFQKGSMLKVKFNLRANSFLLYTFYWVDTQYGGRYELVQSRIQRKRRLCTKDIY
jgi:hypothetical protein